MDKQSGVSRTTLAARVLRHAAPVNASCGRLTTSLLGWVGGAECDAHANRDSKDRGAISSAPHT
jgi:hypothetical protein